MKKSTLLAAVAAAITLASGSSFAEGNMEHCKVTKGSIKAGKADCKTSSHSCAGQNKANDPESWISVPTGHCDKINAGDFMGVDPAIKEKIEVSVK
jgi:uncharacterized membrane protein